MDASPFNKLPAELRNNIYEFALTMPRDIELRCVDREEDQSSVLQLGTSDARDHLRLLSTCKQIRQEALPLFFFCNCIKIHTDLFCTFNQALNEAAMHKASKALKDLLVSLASGANHIRKVSLLPSDSLYPYDELDDFVVSYLPKVLKGFNPLFPNDRTMLGIETNMEWTGAFQDDAALFRTSLIIGNNDEARKALDQALQDPGKIIKESLTKDPLLSGISNEEIHGDLRRAREMIGKLLDALEKESAVSY
ncbi:hypothetical protein CLAFUR0_03312 [Fulvia fulva]|nr:hypothetical protein CLAFUR0_03312 [Fulvia fulva]